ncbi:hypothetical protein K438DRAFT_1970744 [Mycena galopus ATCC 62051]|nr:hypothetical protein K438DRAFT_1970744 [Mycena galopus ATCC 62051]
MVLTRRAATEYYSIIRWLPNEILSLIVLNVRRLDLIALCRTSRLIHEIAVPSLYRVVALSTVLETELFIRTMGGGSPKSASLSRHVRQFALTGRGLALSPALVKAIDSVLCQLCRLEVLSLLVSVVGETLEFTDLLQKAYFPSLSAFQYDVHEDNSVLLPAFLNRHPSITGLTITRSTEPLVELAAVLLPKLLSYNGPSSFVPSFRLGESLTVASLILYADDLDLDRPLLHLSKATSLHSLVVLNASDNMLSESTILACVARYLPRIRTITCRKVWAIAPAAHISSEDTLEITTCLDQFDSLSMLNLSATDDDLEPGPDADRETVVSWGAACKTLILIILNGRQWVRLKGDWQRFT